jgi:predicted O-methyltransferase YrrM
MSACFMAVEIINSGKEILFDCIDTWEHPEISLNSSEINADSTESYEIFLENIEPVKHIINVLKKNSWEIVETYKDESLDFVFIDARHDYLSVRKDLQVWFPKIKPGGIIAGHDYYINMGVFPAVHEFFQNEQNVEQHGNSWLVVKR